MVLQHIEDPYDLWVNCRQVSRAFRQEGERAFQTQFLPRLRFKWTYGGINTSALGSVYFSLSASSDESPSPLGSSSLRLQLRQNGQYQWQPGHNIYGFAIEQDRDFWVTKALCGTDIEFRHRSENAGLHTKGTRTLPHHFLLATFHDDQVCQWYANDPETSIINIRFPRFRPPVRVHVGAVEKNACSITIHWKKVMANFFAEEIYVRSR